MVENQIPFEVVSNEARIEIVNTITAIGNRYQLPISLLLLIVEDIVKDSKIAAYETAFRETGIPNPLQTTPINVEQE